MDDMKSHCSTLLTIIAPAGMLGTWCHDLPWIGTEWLLWRPIRWPEVWSGKWATEHKSSLLECNQICSSKLSTGKFVERDIYSSIVLTLVCCTTFWKSDDSWRLLMQGLSLSGGRHPGMSVLFHDMIKQGLLDDNVFGLWLNARQLDEYAGELSFGAISPSRFTGSLRYANIVQTSPWVLLAASSDCHMYLSTVNDVRHKCLTVQSMLFAVQCSHCLMWQKHQCSLLEQHFKASLLSYKVKNPVIRMMQPPSVKALTVRLITSMWSSSLVKAD